MATITSRPGRDGKNRFTAQIRIKGHSEAQTFSTKTAAKQWAAKREIELREQPRLVGSTAHKHTLGDAIERYLRDVLPEAGVAIQADRPRYLHWWSDRLGHLPLAQVQAPQIAEGRDALKHTPKARGTGTLSPATITQYMLALSHLFSVAVKEWHWISTNPVLAVAKPKVDNGASRFLSVEEIGRLLAACRASESEHLLPLVLMALTTGARDMELRGLRWGALDFERGVVAFHATKNGSSRAAGLAPEVAALLRPRQGAREALVFPGLDPAKPVLIRSAWERACRVAGLTDVRFHTLRHTAASHLAMGGATAPELAGALGHKTLTMVQRYSHLSAGHVQGVTSKLVGVVEAAEVGHG